MEKILVIDDELSNIKSIVQFLKEKGYKVLASQKPKLGYTLVEREKPDVVITDWDMPEMNGLELIRKLKENPHTKNVPVVMATGIHTSTADLEQAMDAGAFDYIRKPINRVELHARIKAAADFAKSYQETQKLSRFKEAMTHMIVHDLKNPIAGILGLATSATEGQMDKDKVASMARQMLDMVQNILDVQKSEETGVNFDLTNVEMGEVVKEVMTQQKILAAEKNINLRYDMLLGDIVIADQNVLIRILSNLVSNAIKFTPENGEIRLYSLYTEEDTMLKIEVHDNGIGIPADQTDKIFDKFYSINPSQGQKVQSTGLGLAFCKMAVAQHGGNIGVVNKPDKGSIFWFTLPLTAKVGHHKETNQKEQTNVFLEEAHKVKANLLGKDKELVRTIVQEIRRQGINHTYPIRLIRVFDVVRSKVEINAPVEAWMLMLQKDATTKVVFEALLEE